MKSALPIFSLLTSCLASPMQTGPAVTIRNGTVIGRTSNQVDSFMGIPYVKPPVGNLRLRAPQPLDAPFGTVVLPETPDACVNMDMSSQDTTGLPEEAIEVINGFSANFTGPSSENCLTLNIQRPSELQPGTKMPVLIWIHGGGFELGTSQWYDGTAIVKKSVEMGQPIVFVAVQYRLNAFGFLNGKELQREAATNLGLRDQRKAMEWVAENIAAFGGDASKVTIWGESAGAASVLDHLIVNNGDHRYHGKALFHGAIMNSGSIIRSLETTSKKAQEAFNDFSAAAGCPVESTQKGAVLDCLRNVSFDKFVAAMNSLPNFMTSRSNDLAYLPRPDSSDSFFSVSPEVAIAEGRFAHVPVIMGNQQDEATVFSVDKGDLVNSTETLINYMATWFPETDRSIVADLVKTYPDDPAAGLPANTGSQWELYPQFKRLSAIQTDLTFLMGRREALSHMASRVPAWSYLSTYMHDFPQFGTYHISDLDTQFSLKVNEFAGNQMDAAYILFVHHQDPNGRADGRGCQMYWPKWSNKDLSMANFGASNVTIMRDDFRWESYKFWKKHSTELRQ